MHTKEEKLEAVGRLLDIMDRLRAECPWNGEQTHDSLRGLTLEEVFELSDAVLSHNDSDTEKELGDLLLHIVFYAKIAEEKGLYDMADIATRECEKMIFRHPHVFAGGGQTDAKTVSEQWELRKLKEREGKHILDGVPESAPSVLKAMQIQRKVRDVGFDWEARPDVWAKVREEIAEFEAEARKLDHCHTEADRPRVSQVAEGDSLADARNDRAAAAHDRAEEELGDVMFALINAARLYGIDPEVALSRTCRKFRRRFDYLEDRTIRSGRLLHSMSLPEMDKIWEEAKSKGL